MTAQPILIGKGTHTVAIDPRYANRHGLIAGATGTGKTITLQGLVESFSQQGVPVFVADIKGDLSGLAMPGQASEGLQKRIEQIGIDGFQYQEYPVTFWDVFGDNGFPIRATISDMGPQLLSRLLRLNDVQEGVLTLAFEFADDEGMMMLDMKDLQSTLEFMAEHKSEIEGAAGKVSKASVGAILRRLLILEREGGEAFFGEPALDYRDLIRTADDGRGIVNVLSAEKLIHSPQVYATFLLWLLSELFESLPEVGDPEKPTFVFFFDEAHLLFDGAPSVFVERVEQVVRLIRSKGVGIYFITQSPADIPDAILGQLGNRVQHALRAYTPKERKAVRVAAQSFRENPELDTETAISELGVGEALVSVLGDDGIPSVVERTLVRPPCSQMGPISADERKVVQMSSLMAGRYDDAIDRESAFEILQQRVTAIAEQAESSASTGRKGRSRQGVGEAFLKSMARSIGSNIGRQLLRGIMGSLFKGR